MNENEKLITLAQLSIVKNYIDEKDKEFIDGGGLITSENGIAGIRVLGGKLQYKQSDDTWGDIAETNGTS